MKKHNQKNHPQSWSGVVKFIYKEKKSKQNSREHFEFVHFQTSTIRQKVAFRYTTFLCAPINFRYEVVNLYA